MEKEEIALKLTLENANAIRTNANRANERFGNTELVKAVTDFYNYVFDNIKIDSEREKP
ncbi:hypothetical protein AGMMS49975_24570 [Clostridia bacterium]|nr:hypothetical protein AGMMS49975_24570 [Clostridia bacterium]